MNKILLIIIMLLIAGGVVYWLNNQPTKIENTQYHPTITPTDFVSKVNNPYFTLKPGTKFTYENKTTEGLERIVVEVTNETKVVLGVTTMVVWDRAWLNDVLKEDTKDLYTQDKLGNVWYFGEAVDNYENGKLKDHAGAWEAGVDGAQPGVVMLADPKVGNSYRQEYYKGRAEDMGDIVALNKKITVPHGTFEGCLQTRDWSMVDASLNEYKYYCPDVGFIVMEESISGGQEKVELIGVSTQ